MRIKFCPFCGAHAAAERCFACGADLDGLRAACVEVKCGEDSPAVLEFGRYPHTADGVQAAMRWLVLEKRGDIVLLLAENVIECKRFHDDPSDSIWGESTLRGWLNGEFLNSAFMEDERDSIVLCTHTDGGNDSCAIDEGEEVVDSAFLLSIGEVERYFGIPFTRRASATEYAAEQGVWRMDNGSACWWLRSPGADKKVAASVNENGHINASGDAVKNSMIGVRPALWVLADAVGLDDE